MNLKELKELKEEMPYKWKIQTSSEWGASCVAYVDARQVQDKLDEVCGPENWQTKYSIVGKLLFCEIGIKSNSFKEGTGRVDDWVWKGDTGTESNMDAEKGHVSDAFKRAAVAWGVGRFLYSLEIIKIPKTMMGQNKSKKWVPMDNGYPLNAKKIQEYCEGKKPQAKQKEKVETNSDKWNEGILAYQSKTIDMDYVKGKYDLDYVEFEKQGENNV